MFVTAGSQVQHFGMGDGNDRVVAEGNIGALNAGAGDGVIVLRGPYLDILHLGAGDDKVVVATSENWSELVVRESGNLKNGVDTLDFPQLGKGVVIKIGSDGGGQEIYKSNKIDAWISETGIENVNSSNKRDFLSIGGKDNELTGSRGKDIFIFGKTAGTNKEVGFEVGPNTIRIKGHAGGFGDLVIESGHIILNGGH